ncbi:tyrosine-protein phosphatase non-receptor type substrate 1-like [Polypterus senegalus]|uniref:tyrosine-protein phosphatase non-receptor type substrate 1-like n=1 Tax=Polypterus senegalus TaxID=55291 RepID=UPI0019644954|nr:tyrosine-protein phosphatase non-receptor type substrate 1-like [Polypterus senegalus]
MKYLTLIFIIPVVLGEFHVFAPYQEVKAAAQSTALLPCFFTVAESKNGLRFVIIIWKHKGTELIQYMDSIVKKSSRTTLLESELQKGNASLVIRNVVFEDEGDYECEVTEAPNSETRRIYLHVTVAPNISLKPPLVVVDQNNSLECRAEGFYPGVVSIEWLRDSQPLSSQGPVEIQNNPDGSFTASNSYTFTPTVSEIGGVFSCLVQHSSLNGGKEEIRLHICKPTLTISPRILKKGETKVYCKLDGCLFSKVTMRWLKNGYTSHVLTCEERRECISSTDVILSIPRKEWEEVSCEADLDGINKPLTEHATVTLEGVPEKTALGVALIVGFIAGFILLTLICVAFVLYKVCKKFQKLCCFYEGQCYVKKQTWRTKRKRKRSSLTDGANMKNKLKLSIFGETTEILKRQQQYQMEEANSHDVRFIETPT